MEQLTAVTQEEADSLRKRDVAGEQPGGFTLTEAKF